MEQGSAVREVPSERGSGTLLTGIAVTAGLAGLGIFLADTQWYNVYKALHVFAATIWVGGGLLLTIAAVLADRARNNAQLIEIGRIAATFGERIATPAAFVVLGFGFALVQEGPWDYDDFFVLFALVGWGVSAATGILVLAPSVKKLNAIAAEKGPEHPDSLAALHRLLAISRFDAVLLALIVVDMTAKPFLF